MVDSLFRGSSWASSLGPFYGFRFGEDINYRERGS